jgi:hypothetical protein
MASTGWLPPRQSDEDRARQLFVAVTGMQAFKPTDEIEAMLAALRWSGNFGQVAKLGSP